MERAMGIEIYLNGIIEALMPNVGYEHVPAKRRAEFVPALESFKPSE